jgi:small basic protein (TIGR04137 family)
MSLDKSLKVKNALARHRNVLTRAERVDRLVAEEKWEDGNSVLGLAKTKVVRALAKKAKAAKVAEGEDADAAVEGEGGEAEGQTSDES